MLQNVGTYVYVPTFINIKFAAVASLLTIEAKERGLVLGRLRGSRSTFARMSQLYWAVPQKQVGHKFKKTQ